MPSKSLYWHTFGSLNNALKEAGFDVPVGEERLERAIDQGAALAVRSGRLPKFADWAQARRDDPSMLTEWQVYRMFDARRGAWSTFQFLIRKRLEDARRGVVARRPDRLVAGQSQQSGHVLAVSRSSSSTACSAARASSADSPGISVRLDQTARPTGSGGRRSTARTGASAGAPRSASAPMRARPARSG